MPLIKKARFFFISFAYKATSLLLLVAGLYLVGLIIDLDNNPNQMGLFGFMFLMVYLVIVSIVWALVFSIMSLATRVNRSVFGIAFLWIAFYFLIFLFFPGNKDHPSLSWYSPVVIQEILIDVLKTLPALVIFVLLVKKDFLSLFGSNANSTKSVVLDEDLIKKQR